MNDAVQANHQAPLEIRIVRFHNEGAGNKRSYRVDLYNRTTDKQRVIISHPNGMTRQEAQEEATSMFAFLGGDLVVYVNLYDEVPRTGNDYVPINESPTPAVYSTDSPKEVV